MRGLVKLFPGPDGTAAASALALLASPPGDLAADMEAIGLDGTSHP